MFSFNFLTTATTLLGFVSIVSAGEWVDRQNVYSKSLRLDTWVWTGVHEISGATKPTDDEIYSLAIVALDDAYNDYEEAKKAGVDLGSAKPPEVLTATVTRDHKIYFSTPLQSVNRNYPFAQVAQDSTDPGAQTITSLLRRCSKKDAPESVARLHEHHAACGEISILYLYSMGHDTPTTISGATDVTVGYNGGRYTIKPPCSKTREAATYGCKDVTTAAHFNDIETAKRISTSDFRKNRMTKLPNPRLQPIINAVPRNCRRGEVGGDGPSCNITMPAF